MFSVKINETTKCLSFVGIFRNLHKFCEYVMLDCKKDGVYMEGMDATKSALFKLHLSHDWFDNYEIGEDDVELGLNCSILSKIFSVYNDKQTIEIKYDSEVTGDVLDVIFDSNIDFMKEFSVPLIDTFDEKKNISVIESDAEFHIETKILSHIINELKLFDEDIHVECSEKHIVFSTCGIDGKMKCVLYDDSNETNDKVNDYTCIEDSVVNITYSLKMFHIFCSFEKVCEEVELAFTKDMPMKMEYKLSHNLGYLSFYLAPKMSDDDDT